jgi:hypothetical protein
MKDPSATVTHRELVDVLESDAIACFTVTTYLRSASFEAKGAGSGEGPPDPGTYLRNEKILHALEISPFASVRQIAGMTLFPETGEYRHHRESLSFLNKKVHWFLQRLSEEQKRVWVEESNELFLTLISMKLHSSRYIITLEESWFDFSTNY